MNKMPNSSIEPVLVFLKQLFQESSGQVWLVGGSVRDALLGRDIRDIDLVAALPPDILEARGFRRVIAKSAALVWFRHFSNFGNVEITLIGSADELPVDLKRRDFTVNAMIMTCDGEVIDPLGGKRDLGCMSLRHCSENVFCDDPLRIFRAFRMESEGFRIAAEAGKIIIGKNWEESLAAIPVERFGREMLKALSAPEPWRFFQKMLEYGVGRVWLPELFRMAQVPAGPPEYHPEGDLMSHSLQVLEQVAARTGSPLARFCAFFHDLGKLSTDPDLYPKHHGHEEAGFKAAEGLFRRLSLPADYGRSLAWICRLHGKANRFEELRLSTRIRMAEQAIRSGAAEILPLVSEADQPGKDFSGKWEKVVAVARLNSSELGLDLKALELLEPSKRSEFVLQKRIGVLKSR
jgi:tRNA nucleotidyltransferase (CCA-adding enzyme)